MRLQLKTTKRCYRGIARLKYVAECFAHLWQGGPIGLHDQRGFAHRDTQLVACGDVEAVADDHGLVDADLFALAEANRRVHGRADTDLIPRPNGQRLRQSDRLRLGKHDGFGLVRTDGHTAVGADADGFVLANVFGTGVTNGNGFVVVYAFAAVVANGQVRVDAGVALEPRNVELMFQSADGALRAWSTKGKRSMTRGSKR